MRCSERALVSQSARCRRSYRNEATRTHIGGARQLLHRGPLAVPSAKPLSSLPWCDLSWRFARDERFESGLR